MINQKDCKCISEDLLEAIEFGFPNEYKGNLEKMLRYLLMAYEAMDRIFCGGHVIGYYKSQPKKYENWVEKLEKRHLDIGDRMFKEADMSIMNEGLFDDIEELLDKYKELEQKVHNYEKIYQITDNQNPYANKIFEEQRMSEIRINERRELAKIAEGEEERRHKRAQEKSRVIQKLKAKLQD